MVSSSTAQVASSNWADVRPETTVRGLLHMVCTLLDLDIAYVTTLNRPADGDGQPTSRTIRMAVTRHGVELTGAAGVTQPLEETWCADVVREDSFVVPDIAASPELEKLPDTASYGIVSHVGVTMKEHSVALGTLCALGHEPRALDARSAQTLAAVADVVEPFLAHIVEPTDNALETDSADQTRAAATPTAVESLTRPLLAALQQLTNLASTYLTQVNEEDGEQHILFSQNSRSDFTMPEGLVVPWDDTLCKRALDEGRPCTDNVPEQWGDSEAARTLGIQVYVSVPIRLSDGSLWGTLCAADSRPVEHAESQLDTMHMFGRLIAAELERTQSLLATAQEAADAVKAAQADSLTGCLTRHAIEPWLSTALHDLAPTEVVVVSFVDVNDFKAVNDTHGHAAGDAVLRAVARRLQASSRPVDLVARYGGDEFLTAARLAEEHLPQYLRRVTDLQTMPVQLDDSTVLDVKLAVGTAHTSGSQAHTTDAVTLIHDADRSMYRRKASAKES